MLFFFYFLCLSQDYKVDVEYLNPQLFQLKKEACRLRAEQRTNAQIDPDSTDLGHGDRFY